MDESMERAVDEMEQAYLEAADGDARDALRRALGDALQELATVSGQVSRGYVRASRPADLARKLGRERRDRDAARAAGR
ncbi:hypothetical protein FV229_00530 [Methylobacterium sp. WL120]|jgi:hypothetical protein|nr:hypothetical protein [Methylobacterium sp. WL120]TXM71195.1 hypothetical protein FV229_00530 [Methylobacterium sp. WL120]